MFTDDYGNRRFPGLYRGLVFDNRDPLGRGRVKLQVPQVLGDAVTDWAWAKYTPGVQHHEPSVGAGVWVEFEGGDPSYPVWDSEFTSAGSVDWIQINPEHEGASTEVGMLTWNVFDETPEVKVGNGEVTLQVGQEEHVRVYNPSETEIPENRVVYLSGGSTEGHPHAALYRADGTISPFRVVGVTTQVIPANSDGLVTVSGKVRNVNTSAFVAGDILFASATEYGLFQTTLATAPDDIVSVATVVVADETAGEVLVKVVPLINQLQTNLVFFPTTVASDVSSYNKMVNSTLDSDYNDVEVNVRVPTTGYLNSTDEVLVGQLIADANEFVGNPGTVEVSTIGAIRKIYGNNNTRALFYSKIYRRTSAGVETLMGTSNKVGPIAAVTLNQYEQFQADATVTFETFSNTDRLVVKFYADVDLNGDQAYEFRFGGLAPVRILVPVPVSVVSTPTASVVTVDTSNFGGNLSALDDTVQKALDTIDDLAFGGGGQVTVSSTPPTSPTPAEGDVWVSDTDGASYVYYTDGTSNQWIQIGASTAAYPPAAFVDVVSFSLSATVTRIGLSATATPKFIHPEIVVSATTDSFQVTKAGYYEFGFEGAATSIESGNRVTLQAYVSTTSPAQTSPASTFRDVRTFDSAVAAGTIGVNGSWFNYLTPSDYVAFYASCNATDGTISTSGQLYIRRIG